MDNKVKLALISVPIILFFLYAAIALKTSQLGSFLSLISVIIGASISACSIVLYNDFILEKERIKEENQQAEKEDKILFLLQDKFRENIFILKYNKNAAEKSISSVSRNTLSITPLKRFHTAFWDTIRTNTPTKVSEPNIFNDISDCVLILKAANEEMQKRELYQIINMENTQSLQTISLFDDDLLNTFESLEKLFKTILESLGYDQLLELLDKDLMH